MKSHYELVCDFNKAFDYKVYNLHEGNPLELNPKDAQYRYDLIHEEGIFELGIAIKTNNRVETMDAIADLLYVLYGACFTYNLNPDFFIKEIDLNDLKMFVINNDYNDYYNDLIIIINKLKYSSVIHMIHPYKSTIHLDLIPNKQYLMSIVQSIRTMSKLKENCKYEKNKGII